MRVLVSTLSFCLLLTLIFTLVTYLVPQVEGEAPVETEIDLSSITMDDYVSLGEDLFNNKGTCTLCHKAAPLGRAPDIQAMDMLTTTEERLADSRYKGAASDTQSYLMESMTDPSAYVVEGWGKKGSNDSVSPMPAVDKAPIELSLTELNAIVAYLQAKDGNQITVELPTADASVAIAAANDESSTNTDNTPAPAENAIDALNKYTCTACHSLDTNDALVGPGFLGIGSRMTVLEIRESIVDPNAIIAEGFAAAMPTDFADKMTVRELDMIVNKLAENL